MNDDDSSETSLPPHKILVAIDSSPASRQALTYLLHGVVPPNAEVLIISVAENPRTLIPTRVPACGGSRNVAPQQ